MMENKVAASRLSLILLRVMTSGIFIVAGFNGHLINPQKTAGKPSGRSELPEFKIKNKSNLQKLNKNENCD